MGGEEDRLTGLRDVRKPCHFWVDNEVADCYQPIVGADAIWVYCRIARYAHGARIVSPKRRGGDSRVSLREIAEWCGKSADTVARCLAVLEHVGLLYAARGAKSGGSYALRDVKDLVVREGAEYDRETGSFQLPAARAAELTREVKALRVKLARKLGRKSGESVAQSDRLESPILFAPPGKCDRSVAQSDKSVALDVQTSINRKLQDYKRTTPPTPPQAGGAAPEHPALDPDQIAHLERLADNPEGHKSWARFYREQNVARAAEAGRKAVEEAAAREREEGLKAEMPDRQAARKWVLRGCCFRENGRRNGIGAVVEDVLEMHEHAGRAWWLTGAEMVEAWQRQQRAGPELPRKLPAAKFFGTGYWREPNGWHWDHALLRRTAQAGAGSV